MSNKFISALDVAKLLNVSRDFVYAHAHAHELGGLRFDRLWRFPSESVEDWIRQRQLALRRSLEPMTADDNWARQEHFKGNKEFAALRISQRCVAPSGDTKDRHGLRAALDRHRCKKTP